MKKADEMKPQVESERRDMIAIPPANRRDESAGLFCVVNTESSCTSGPDADPLEV